MSGSFRTEYGRTGDITPFKRTVAADRPPTATEPTVTTQDPEERVREGRARLSEPAAAAELVDLYPAGGTASRKEFRNAMRLLAEARTYADAALEADPDKDVIGADFAVGRIRALLPELFSCRTLSDSFGMTTAALIAAFANQPGEPLSRAQLVVVRSVLRSISQAPFMPFGKAVEVVSRLEEVGLDVDPKGLAEIGELVDE